MTALLLSPRTPGVALAQRIRDLPKEQKEIHDAINEANRLFNEEWQKQKMDPNNNLVEKARLFIPIDKRVAYEPGPVLKGLMGKIIDDQVIPQKISVYEISEPSFLNSGTTNVLQVTNNITGSVDNLLLPIVNNYYINNFHRESPELSKNITLAQIPQLKRSVVQNELVHYVLEKTVGERFFHKGGLFRIELNHFGSWKYGNLKPPANNLVAGEFLSDVVSINEEPDVAVFTTGVVVAPHGNYDFTRNFITEAVRHFAANNQININQTMMWNPNNIKELFGDKFPAFLEFLKDRMTAAGESMLKHMKGQGLVKSRIE